MAGEELEVLVPKRLVLTEVLVASMALVVVPEAGLAESVKMMVGQEPLVSSA